MIVTQTTIITFTWEDFDPQIGEQLIREGFKCEVCTVGLSYSKTQITSRKLVEKEE